MGRYLNVGGVAVDLCPAATLSLPYPSSPLSDGVASASSSRTAVTVTASSTPHSTAGASWVEVEPSLSADADGIVLYADVATNGNSVDTSTLLEIGLGGAGAEVVWTTIPVGYRPAGTGPTRVPGGIPAGSRVSFRLRSAVASKSVGPIHVAFEPATVGLLAPVTIGADTATSRGVTLTAPGSLNTKGPWTELAASTPEDLTVIYLGPQGAGSTNFISAVGLLIDLGIGPSGSEQVVVGDVGISSSSQELLTIRFPMTYAVDVPAGSRLVARYARGASTIPLDLIVVGAGPA